MKKSTGPSFIQRVLDLFRDEKDDSTVQPLSDESPVEKDTPSPDWHPNAQRTSRAHNTVDKSYESNLDRYKHPSDLHRGR
ncbi:MAG: hypothetical protein KTR29_13600 [Rhodothermaceae bacterium]|nr:hypothetical protein [Rhodothermaceae bacterium]